LITAAYNLRHGRVQRWMRHLNDIMKGIRVSVEWSFGKITSRNKHTTYRQKIQESPVISIYMMSSLITNAHTCLRTLLHFEVKSPTLEEYFSQI
jgi:hypothetical protein